MVIALAGNSNKRVPHELRGYDSRSVGWRSDRGALVCAAMSADETLQQSDLLKELKALVARCDGAEGVQPDGSNMQTITAHAAIAKAEGHE